MKIKALVLAFLLAAANLHAQSVTPVGRNLNSDTAGSVAILVKYIGTSTSATTDIAVAAGGDATFRVAGAADTAVNTVAAGSLCGATPGTLDLSTPAATCDTLGEVVDVINASGTWIAVLVDGLRTDLSDNTLFTRSVTSGVEAAGVPLFFDSTVSLHASVALIPSGCETNIRCFTTPSNKILENPVGGTYSVIRFLEGQSAFATTSTWQVFSVKSSNKTGTSVETVSTLMTATTGATGVSSTPIALTAGPVVGRSHEKIIVRILNTGASSAFRINVNGERRSVNQP
jgi:hypothetical protein